jgi:hypothetical protein
VSPRLDHAIDEAIAGLWSGMSAETILIDLLRVIREETQRPADAGKEETP